MTKGGNTNQHGSGPEPSWLHWGRWVFAGIFIIALFSLTVPLVRAIQDYQEVQAARSVVWNEVSYPQGNVGTVVPDAVEPGETVFVTFKEYCNKGVDVRIERWLDFIGEDGEPFAAYGLTPLEFYGAKFKNLQTPTTGSSGGCVKNQTQAVGLPAEIAGRPPGDSKVRLRNRLTYVKPEQVIHVDSYSETFTLLAQPEKSTPPA